MNLIFVFIWTNPSIVFTDSSLKEISHKVERALSSWISIRLCHVCLAHLPSSYLCIKKQLLSLISLLEKLNYKHLKINNFKWSWLSIWVTRFRIKYFILIVSNEVMIPLLPFLKTDPVVCEYVIYMKKSVECFLLIL